MTESTGPEHRLGDDELDALLATTGDELLSYLQDRTDPAALWNALLVERQDPPVPSPVPSPGPAEAELRGPQAVRHLGRRVQAYRIVRDLDLVGERVRGVVFDRTLVLDYNRMIALAHDQVLPGLLELLRDRADDLVRDLALPPDRDPGLARDLVRDLAHALGLVLDLAHGRVPLRELVRALDTAYDHAYDLDRLLIADQLSVAGADLSWLDVEPGDGPALTWVCWDDATTWPAAVADTIRARSVELRPGVYEIRSGLGRNHAPLG